MLLLPTNNKPWENMYYELLTFYTKAKEFDQLQVVYLTKEQQSKLKIEILPCFVDPSGNSLISYQEIAQILLYPSTLDINLIGQTDKEANETFKFFSLPQSLNWQELQIAQQIEKTLAGNTFIETNRNLRIIDIFYFCFLYRLMVESSEDFKFTHPDLYRWFFYL